MPEGDSIFVLARKLRPALVGRRVEHAELRVPAYATLDLSGSQITGIDTHGKHQLTRFVTPGGEALTLHTHLKMTGSWTVVSPGKRLPSRLMDSVRVLLELDGGATAYGLDLPVVPHYLLHLHVLHVWHIVQRDTTLLAGVADDQRAATEDAVQQGLLDPARPARIPEWSDDPRVAITLDQLLRMASGLHSDTAGNRTDALYMGATTVTQEVVVIAPLISIYGSRLSAAGQEKHDHLIPGCRSEGRACLMCYDN